MVVSCVGAAAPGMAAVLGFSAGSAGAIITGLVVGAVIGAIVAAAADAATQALFSGGVVDGAILGALAFAGTYGKTIYRMWKKHRVSKGA